MSKIVTDRQFNLLVNHLDAPFNEKVTVHESLDWIREEKRIVVDFYANDIFINDSIYSPDIDCGHASKLTLSELQEHFKRA